MQAALQAHGYGPFADGVFDAAMTAVVKLFQSQHVDAKARPLDADGIIGPLSWGAIYTQAPQIPSATVPEVMAAAVAIAQGEIGTQESPAGANRGPRVDDYLRSVGIDPTHGTPNDRFWCMAFAYFCVNTAATQKAMPNPLPKSASVLGQWHACQNRPGVRAIPADQARSNPALVRPGQLLILDHGGGLGHTGIVTDCDGPHLTVVEGNSSGKPNDRNGVGVFETKFRKLQDSQIAGFIEYGV
nr:peptidoglycan-binding domain-containing protein [Rhizomicrobium palustre]